MEGVFTNLQNNYGQLMLYKLLEREDIFKKKIYNPRDLITTVFSAAKKILEFADIAGMYRTQIQAVNIAYVIIDRTCKSRLAICEWNRMPETQKTYVRFKQIFGQLTESCDMRLTSPSKTTVCIMPTWCTI